MAAGLEHGYQQNAAHQGGGQPAGQQHQQMGGGGVLGQDSSGVTAYAHKGGPGEINHAHESELDVQPEAGQRVDQHRSDEKKNEGVIVEPQAHAGDSH